MSSFSLRNDHNRMLFTLVQAFTLSSKSTGQKGGNESQKQKQPGVSPLHTSPTQLPATGRLFPGPSPSRSAPASSLVPYGNFRVTATSTKGARPHSGPVSPALVAMETLVLWKQQVPADSLQVPHCPAVQPSEDLGTGRARGEKPDTHR